MDDQIRVATFEWLKHQTEIHDDVLHRDILENGFFFEGQRITVIGAKGIWKPKAMQLPLSITTTAESPYDDSFTPDDFLLYRYRGTDPNHPDNRGLREVMSKGIPLIYFHSMIKGLYLAAWPVFIIGEDAKGLSFKVAVDDSLKITSGTLAEDPATYYRRSYLTSTFQVRLHQKSFRERVLYAYQNQCALCKLKHKELLDAAHIIPDKKEYGQPIVSNGLSLCKIHHAAFDKFIIGVSPDYTIKIRKDILEETDGPMLKHGLQFLENKKIILPFHKKDWPDRERLEERFRQFRVA
ncbi:MAG: HNH endonuclease [Bacteroidales bacterium]|nr:HNH endonuclease [Bacteroidales bacterium]